jgi:uncharacterized protein (UPF0332 family)
VSQASKHVQWCLNKAKKELQEQKFHRGLEEVAPNKNIAEKYIAKAEHNLQASSYFKDGGFSDWSASAFFYSMYHCLLAILRKFGYESKNQECTFAVIDFLCEEKKISLDKRFVDTLRMTKLQEVDHSVVKTREDYQYGFQLELVEMEDFERLSKLCRELINRTKEIIHR